MRIEINLGTDSSPQFVKFDARNLITVNGLMFRKNAETGKLEYSADNGNNWARA